MIVSGLTIESKKASTSSKPKIPKQSIHIRPSSYQLPQINEARALTSTKFIMNKNTMLEQSLPKPLTKIKTASRTNTKNYTSQNYLAMKRNNKDTKEIREIKEATRKNKKIELNKTEEQCLFEQETSLMAFYRYAPISVIAASGTKEEFMELLADKKDFSSVGPKPKRKKGLQPIWDKLIKLALLKGKYKYRQKFNFIYSAQLKALDYKRKEQKKRKESSSSSSDDELDRKEKCRDLQTWKKSMGVEDSKVFIIKGKYPDLKNALLERGWVQNQDKHSMLYDLKWTTKVSDVNFESLRPHQLVNHFNNNACLTSKYGLIKSLRSIMFSESIDIDSFFPKAFDMSDLQDFQNFLQVYKWVYAASIIKQSVSKEEPPKDISRVTLALIVSLRRLLPAEKMLSGISANRFPLCSPAQWNYLTLSKQVDPPINTLIEWDMKDIEWQDLRLGIMSALQKLEQKDPQTLLDGYSNVWIVKPAFLSRGRGIKCLNQLSDILDYSMGKETQYIVQKYIQNPLLLQKRKFDIRQWVIVEEYNPPKIWFYSQFYARLCLEQYDLSKLNNRFMHLTNNSVQKHSSKVTKQIIMTESMWTMEQFRQYVEQIYGEGSIKQIVAKIKQIVIATILGTQDQVYGRKKSFQLIGYDFMIDDKLNPWLIEVNSSPAMDYSTEVTRKLVKMVLEDTVKVMIDPYKKKTKKKGLFRLIYDGESAYEFKRYRMTPNEKQ